MMTVQGHQHFGRQVGYIGRQFGSNKKIMYMALVIALDLSLLLVS